MTVLKWLLLIFGVLFLAFLAVVIGGYYWASTVESVKITAEDIKVGGAYPAEERQALLDACNKNMKTPAADKNACTCIADKAGTDLSRFERLALTAGFEGSPTKIVALTKGLMDSGIPQSDVEAMQAGSKKRINDLMKACGLETRNDGIRPCSARTITTTCCVVGGGPAGMMLGLLLARAGVDVTILEKHADFLRDFRGDTIHPSTLCVMEELGLLDELLKLPHNPVRELQVRISDETINLQLRLPAEEARLHRHDAAMALPQLSRRSRDGAIPISICTCWRT